MRHQHSAVVAIIMEHKPPPLVMLGHHGRPVVSLTHEFPRPGPKPSEPQSHRGKRQLFGVDVGSCAALERGAI